MDVATTAQTQHQHSTDHWTELLNSERVKGKLNTDYITLHFLLTDNKTNRPNLFEYWQHNTVPLPNSNTNRVRCTVVQYTTQHHTNQTTCTWRTLLLHYTSTVYTTQLTEEEQQQTDHRYIEILESRVDNGSTPTLNIRITHTIKQWKIRTMYLLLPNRTCELEVAKAQEKKFFQVT